MSTDNAGKPVDLLAALQRSITAAKTDRAKHPATPAEVEHEPGENDHWSCGACGHEGNGPDNVEWYEHTKVCPGPPAEPDAGDADGPSVLRKIITAAIADAERTGMTGRTVEEWVASTVLASDWLATREREAEQRGAEKALRDAADEVGKRYTTADWLRFRADAIGSR